MNEYEKLVQAEKSCHTIKVREKATGKEGVANTCEYGVQVFYGANDGSDDKTVSSEVFNLDFEIIAKIALMKANMKAEDYTLEYCPYYEAVVAIRRREQLARLAGKRLRLVLFVFLSTMTVNSQIRVLTDVLVVLLINFCRLPIRP